MKSSDELVRYGSGAVAWFLCLKLSALEALSAAAALRLVVYRATVVLVLISAASLMGYSLHVDSPFQWSNFLHDVAFSLVLFFIAYSIECLIWFHEQPPVFYTIDELKVWSPSRTRFMVLVMVIGGLSTAVIPINRAFQSSRGVTGFSGDPTLNRVEATIAEEVERRKGDLTVVASNIQEDVLQSVGKVGGNASQLSVSERFITGRKALIIALSNYPNAELPGVAKDAVLLRQTFEKSGYDVTVVSDKSRDQIEAAVKQYRSKLQRKDLNVVYIAGHGKQQDGVNFLLGLDWIEGGGGGAKLADLGISLNTLINDFVVSEKAAKYNLFIFDACREIASGGSGLASFVKSSNKYGILTAADDGQKAADECRTCRGNGPFALALSRHFWKPIDYRIMLGNVRGEVEVLLDDYKDDKQIPSFKDYSTDKPFVLANVVQSSLVNKAQSTLVPKRGASERSATIADCDGLDSAVCLSAMRAWVDQVEGQYDSIAISANSSAADSFSDDGSQTPFLGDQLQHWRVDRHVLIFWLLLWFSLLLVLLISWRMTRAAYLEYQDILVRRNHWIVKHAHFLVDEYIAGSMNESERPRVLEPNWDLEADFYPVSERSRVILAAKDVVGSSDHLDFARSLDSHGSGKG